MKKELKSYDAKIGQLSVRHGKLVSSSSDKSAAAAELRDQALALNAQLRRLGIDKAKGQKINGELQEVTDELDKVAAQERALFQEAEIEQAAARELNAEIRELETQRTTYLRTARPKVYKDLLPEYQARALQAIADLCVVYARRDGLPLTMISPERVTQLALGENRLNIGSNGPLREAYDEAQQRFDKDLGA